MRDKPKLQVTKDYSIFELHPMNRDLHDKPLLLESLRTRGFMPSSPIQCVRNGSGKLKVIRGHHRLDYAKRLRIPVWYVIDDTNTNLYDLEGDPSAMWNVRDFLYSRAKAGDEACAKVKAFQRKHGISMGSALSLLGGETGANGNQNRKVKSGAFKVAADLTHANRVVDLVGAFREAGVKFCGASAFVSALSMVLRVPECSPEVFRHRVRLNPTLMQKRTNVTDYLNELDGLYNYGAKSGRIPLAFKAKQLSRERHVTFGGKQRAAR